MKMARPLDYLSPLGAVDDLAPSLPPTLFSAALSDARSLELGGPPRPPVAATIAPRWRHPRPSSASQRTRLTPSAPLFSPPGQVVL
jgi:hypothetical protein